MITVVYLWLTPSGVPYYVGIGSEQRAHRFKRNPFTNKVTAKHGTPTVRILARCHGRKVAEKLERRWIRHYGRRDLGTGTLTNLTAGGDTVTKLRPEARARISVARKRAMATPEGKSAVAEANRRRVLTPEQRARRSAAMMGNQHCKGKRWTYTGAKYEQAVRLAQRARDVKNTTR